MTAEKFYEQQRLLGLTEHITGNPEPDYNLSFYQQIFQLMEEYAKLKLSEHSALKEQWISVDERLPEIGEYILVFTQTTNIGSSTQQKISIYSKYGFESASNVTHWQPLPKPPVKK